MVSKDIETVTIGILIPTYERARFLEQALASAITQSYRKIEIIVIDNGNDDALHNHFTQMDFPRVSYIRNEENVFLIGSVRKGIQLFSSAVTWITILPDDDLLDRDFVKAMVDHVKLHPEAVVVHGHRNLINNIGEKIGETSVPPQHESAIEYLMNRSLFLRQSFLCGVFFSRAAYDQIGGYPEFTTGMATDDALIYALSLNSGLYFNNNSSASVRMHPAAESHSSSNTIKHMRAYEDFEKYILKISELKNKYSSEDLKIIRKFLDRYTRASIGGLWLRRVHELLLNDALTHNQELTKFYKLSKGNEIHFPLRVRFSVFFATIFHWNPETNKLYRIFVASLSRAKDSILMVLMTFRQIPARRKSKTR
jgi:GT2 family glycosyltransferase